MGSLLRSTGIIALSTFSSRILGFLRDMLMAAFFGANFATDAFFVAFRIPNFFRRLVAEGALTISFIPVYTDYLVTRGEEQALQLGQKMFTLQMGFILVLVLLGMIFSPEIVNIFAIGFTDIGTINLAIGLTRIMFPYLFFVGFVAFSMGILNPHGYFFAPAFSPVLLNIGMISGIVFFSSFFTVPIYGVTLGVLLGGLMQLVLQIPYLIKSGFKLKISFDLNDPGIRKVLALIGPAIFGMAIIQINTLVNTALASTLDSGSISYIYYSDRLTEMVLGVFIVSIGNVVLPEMSKMTALNDIDKLKNLYASAIKSALFLAIPAAVALMVAGFPFISVLFMRGKFTPDKAILTYHALLFASMGIPAVAILRITTPTFYSLKDTKTPVVTSSINLILNAILGYILMHTFLKHAGLTLSMSIAATVQTVVLVFFLHKKIKGLPWKNILPAIFKNIVASLGMAAVIFFLMGKINWLTSGLLLRILFVGLIVSIGGGVYLFISYILKVQEMTFVVQKIIGKIKK